MPSQAPDFPAVSTLPRHIAIIMDGNGRWAKRRFLPRVAGHKRGLDAVRETVKNCSRLGIEYLTLFAFSSENWRRPPDEVHFLMRLFLEALEREVKRMHKNDIRLKIIGNRAHFSPDLCERIAHAERLTANNRGLVVTVAADYGGRWDILQAVNQAILQKTQNNQTLTNITEAELQAHLSLANVPEPDLFIRTGGEKRISNFLLWQLAYTELFFTPTLWPDFNASTLQEALQSYGERERRFGRTSEQLPPEQQRPD